MKKPLLIVQAAPTGIDHAGDEVVFRHTVKYLSELFDISFFYLSRADRGTQIVEMLKGAPPEVAGYLSPDNMRKFEAFLAQNPFEVVCFFNETSIAYSAAAVRAGARCVLVSHNTHSLVGRTDPSWISRALTPLAVKFERKFYADPNLRLVCISECDREALKDVGIVRDDIVLSPPGAPPASPLSPTARLAPEVVLTGSYGWWRKRRDVKAFARTVGESFPIWVADPIAQAALAGSGLEIRDGAPDWSNLRFGLVTDRFVGGFKLKSTEYVARNCIILSCADIGVEFKGLPHAEEFVRLVHSAAEIPALIDAYSQDPGVVARFTLFKAACLERFNWRPCLEPLGQALEAEFKTPR